VERALRGSEAPGATSRRRYTVRTHGVTRDDQLRPGVDPGRDAYGAGR